ncbi:MAG: hypothetical protein CVT77_07680 [Alphaproteobacteria bacterium HGW-Alphaproteobacteria-16]|nr:MAG: hypothetical protein CVT77_07680 [Alphaproteobacteria bacterium HGW-Alphaproteobacteria-16]
MRALLALTLIALPAAAQDWPAKTDRKPLSARAQKIAGPDYYLKGDDLEYTAKELAACTAPPGKPDYCVDVVLSLAQGFDATQRPLMAAAIDTILTRYPVDPFPLLLLRQPPRGDRMGGLQSLALAEYETGAISELACPNTRVRLALALARWRMGGTAVPPDRSQAIDQCGADSPEAIATANATAVIFGARGGPSPELLALLKQAHEDALRIFGPDDRRTAIVAANRGALLADYGDQVEAEPLLRTAFARLEREADPAPALAVLVPLTEVLLELGRVDEARALINGATARDPAIGGPALHIRALVAQARLTPDNTAALALFDRATTLARAAVAAKPDATLVAFQRDQVMRLGEAFRNMDMFQRSIDMERDELVRLANARLAQTLTARAARAFAAGNAPLARDSAREARTLDSSLRRAFLFEGLASLATGEPGNSEFLFGSAAMGLPANHPDRVLIAMGMTYYSLGWSAAYAPCYARKATAAALARLDSQRIDSADNTEQFRSYAPVFRLQVAASWASAQSQARVTFDTPRTCPAGGV